MSSKACEASPQPWLRYSMAVATLSVSATNLLDQKRVHALGGSVIERRVLVTLGWAR